MIVSVPLALPVAVGAKVTVTVHCASTANDAGHGLLRVNPAPDNWTARLPRAALPEFPIVSIFIALEFTATVPKSRDVELMETIGAGAGAVVRDTPVGELSAFD